MKSGEVKKPAGAKTCAVSRPTRTREATAAANGPAGSYIYTEAMADEICRRLADGESLKSICRTKGMPDRATVVTWALDTTHPFAQRYARAREIGYTHLADEILEISDDSEGDIIQGEDGRKTVDHENIARARLRVETRKWILSKMLPKIYGDKLQTDLNGTLTLEQLVLQSYKPEAQVEDVQEFASGAKLPR